MDHVTLRKIITWGTRFFPPWYEHFEREQDFHQVVKGLDWGPGNADGFRARPFYSRGLKTLLGCGLRV